MTVAVGEIHFEASEPRSGSECVVSVAKPGRRRAARMRAPSGSAIEAERFGDVVVGARIEGFSTLS